MCSPELVRKVEAWTESLGKVEKRIHGRDFQEVECTQTHNTLCLVQIQDGHTREKSIDPLLDRNCIIQLTCYHDGEESAK